jgi:hypothetical protein
MVNTNGTAALFASCEGATIKNLTVKGSVTGSLGAAGIVFSMTGVYTNGVLSAEGAIINCRNEATVTTTADDGGISGAAGIVVSARDTNISGCVNTGNITSQNAHAAGIVTHFRDTTNTARGWNITDCVNSGTITAQYIAAGIAGQIMGTSDAAVVNVTGCTNLGAVTSLALPNLDRAWPNNSAYTNGNGGPSAAHTAAGIIGVHITVKLNISNVTNSGTITGNGNNVAGIIGSTSMIQPGFGTGNLAINDSSNTGSITSTYDGTEFANYISVGGIGGNLKGTHSRGEDWSPNSVNATGNSNTGTITVGSATNVSSIIGRLPGTTVNLNDNTTTVLVGNDASNANIRYIDPNPTVITPDQGNGGGSASTPAPAAARTPVRSVVVAPAAVNAPVVVAASPESTAQTALPEQNVASQPETIGDLNVPTTVTEETRQNNLLPIILIIVIVVAVAILLIRGAKKRRGSTEG